MVEYELRNMTSPEDKGLKHCKKWLARYAQDLDYWGTLEKLKLAAKDGERKLAVKLSKIYRLHLWKMRKNFRWLIDVKEKTITKNQLDYLPEKFKHSEDPAIEIIKVVEKWGLTNELERILSEKLGIEKDHIHKGPVKTAKRVTQKAKEYLEEAYDDSGRWAHFFTKFQQNPEDLPAKAFAFAVLDYCRVSIECWEEDVLEKIEKVRDSGYEIVALKNLFRPDAKINEESQYRDLKILLAVPFSVWDSTIKLIVEVQFLLHDWLVVKKVNSIHYKINRAQSGVILQQDCSKYNDQFKKEKPASASPIALNHFEGNDMSLKEPLLSDYPSDQTFEEMVNRT